MVLRAFQRKGSRERDRAAGPAVLRTAEAGFARLPRLRRGGLRPYLSPCTGPPYGVTVRAVSSAGSKINPERSTRCPLL